MKLKSIAITGLLLMSLVFSSSTAFGATLEKDSANANAAKSASPSVVTPNDVGNPTQKTLGGATHYYVTQTDIDNARTQTGYIVQAVAAGIGSYFTGPLGAVVATYFGNQAGDYLGDVIASTMQTGYYYDNSTQTYKFLSGTLWQWQYGSTAIENETTGQWYFFTSTAPPNIYVNNL